MISLKKVYVVVAMLFGMFVIAGIQMSAPFDEGVYYDYAKSLVDDGDFNIINQVKSPYQKWLVSPTYNHPDFHHELASLVYVPVYAVHKIIKPSVVQSTNIDYALISLLFTLALYFAYKSFEQEFSLKQYRIYYLPLFFGGTYLFWNIFFAPSDIDLVVALLGGIISLEFVKLFEKKPNTEDAFYFAVLVGAGVSLKTDFVFSAPLLLILFLRHFSAKAYKECGLMIAGFAIAVLPLMINRYLKIGAFNQDAFSSTMSLKSFSHLIKLFGPSGTFLNSPLLFVAAVAGFIILLKEKRTFFSNPFSYLFLIFCVKLVLYEFITVKYLITLGDRQYVADWVMALYFAHRLFTYLEKKIYKILLCAFLLFGSLFFKLSYFTDTVANTGRWALKYWVFYPDALLKIIVVPKHYFVEMMNQFSLSQLFYYFAILMLMVAAVCYLYKLKRKAIYVVVVLMYFATFSNIIFNHANVAKLKAENYFQTAVVGKDQLLFYDEFMDLFHLGEHQAEVMKEKDYYDRVEQVKSKYLESIQNDILVDPINFKNDLMLNKPRPSFWQLLYP
jgi:hypothetical protein